MCLVNKNINVQTVKREKRERELFERVHKIITEQQLYLDPMFSRKKFITISFVNKNKVARLLTKYTGTNLNGYINGLRVDYALKLMLEHPDASLKAISADAGFNNIRTFYRAFFAKFGVTPSTYKMNHETTGCGFLH